jgi:hypothetical protein
MKFLSSLPFPSPPRDCVVIMTEGRFGRDRLSGSVREMPFR